MGLVRKLESYSSSKSGTLLFVSMRLPFRVFSKNPDIILFQPALSGAGWHKLNLEVLTPELFSELLDKEDAMSAMSFLRTNGMIHE